MEAQENERRSISRELHDEVGQALSGVLVEIGEPVDAHPRRDLDGLAVKTDEIKKLVEDSIGVVRNMALLLRPSMLDDLGLVPALQWQAREVSKRGRCGSAWRRKGFPRICPKSTRPASTALCKRPCTIACSTPARNCEGYRAPGA